MPVYLFNDDFNGPAGSPPDPRRWSFDTGKWPYNNEMEIYTNSETNCFQDGDSNLVIRAVRSRGLGHEAFTSARIHTMRKFELTDGFFEARIRIERKAGTWPAFWMMGDNKAGWPWCGEIDIMESYGYLDWAPDSSVHTADYPDGSGNYTDAIRSTDIPGGVDGQYHSYKMHHDALTGDIEFYKDDTLYSIVRPGDLPHWPFCEPGKQGVPLYFILNLAVGGDGGGALPASTKFPVSMYIDWVRAWR